jgi:HEAT repeat protein
VNRLPIRIPLGVALCAAAAASAWAQPCSTHPPAFRPAGATGPAPAPAPSPSPVPTPSPTPSPGGGATPGHTNPGTTPRQPGRNGGVTKSERGSRTTSTFDWRAWWEANRWQYLAIRPLAVEKSGSSALAGDASACAMPLSDAARASAIAKLRTAWTSGKDSLEREAIAALASIAGADASADVVGAAEGDDAERRLAAFFASARLTTGGGLESLRAAVRNASRTPLERGAAAVVLGIRGDSAAFESMAALANDARQPLEARMGAVIGLGVAGGDALAAPIAVLARDKEARMLKLAAAFALGRSGDAKAVEPLAQLLKHGDSADLRRAAASSLGALAVHAKHPLGGGAATRAGDALLDAAQTDTDIAVRGLALVSLAQTGNAGGHAECVRILKEGSGELVVPALLALGVGGDLLDADTILPFLSGDATMRAPAALALGMLRCEAAKGPIRELFEKTNDRIAKQYAALALGYLRDSLSAPALSGYLADADRDGAEAGVQALGLMGSYQAVVALRGAADSSSSVETRALALEMLGRLHDTQSQRRFEDVLAAANRSDVERAGAIRALGFLGAPEGWVPPMRQVFSNRDWDMKGPLLKTLVACL